MHLIGIQSLGIRRFAFLIAAEKLDFKLLLAENSNTVSYFSMSACTDSAYLLCIERSMQQHRALSGFGEISSSHR